MKNGQNRQRLRRRRRVQGCAIVHNKQGRSFFNDTRGAYGGALGLRAVVFDYGMVLTGPPDPKAYYELLRLTGLDQVQLNTFYWADRHAYDEGKLTGIEFWQKIDRDAGLKLDANSIEALNVWDARMWTTKNDAMVAWQQRLRERGIKTAILSNMGDSVHENIALEFEWIKRFDVLVWSYQLKMAKPDPAIFRYVLEKLGTRPEETLFLDDKQVNVDAAKELGFRSLVFSNVEQLRQDLIAAGLNAEIPLP
jgi:putative hydrolase of the HAD superfamily